MRLLSSVLLLLVAATCTYGAGTITVLPYAPEVRLMGRWTVNSGNSGAVGDWPAIAAQLTFTNATFVSFAASTSSSDYVNAIITVPNTTETLVSTAYKLDSSATTYAISLELNPNVIYKVEVSKRTEPSQGILTFYGFQLNTGAILINEAAPARRVEFIGADTLSGRGVEGVAGSACTPATSNAWLTWGPMLARAFNADYHVEAWSGTGVVQSNSAVVGNSEVTNLPAVFNRTVASSASYGNWNFSLWQPHAIFVNIGENDFTGTSTMTNDTFVSELDTFLEQITTTYAASMPFLFVACGPIITNPALCTYIATAAGLAGGVLINFQDVLTNPADFGCDGNPSIAGQLKLAQFAIPLVTTNLGWTAGNIIVPPINVTTPPISNTTTGNTTDTGNSTTTPSPSPSPSPTTGSLNTTTTGVVQATTGNTTTPSTSSAAVAVPSILTFFGLSVIMVLASLL